MCIIVVVLAIEEITAASLRVQVPKHYTKTALSEEAGQVDGCSSFTNAPFDVINGDFFQKVKLITKL